MYDRWVYVAVFLLCIITTSYSDNLRAYQMIGIENVDTCNILQFSSFDANFGSCFLTNVENQPNCSIYYDCLLHSTTYVDYQACLVPTFQIYAFINANNATSYKVEIFLNSDCSGMPIQDPIYIPYGCYYGMFVDANNTDCGITRRITTIPSESSASLLSIFWLDF